jgi:hypothetical protein
VNHADLCRPLEHRISRRRWFGGVAAGTAAAALGLAQPAPTEQVRKKHKQVLFIWLDGGMSQLESWDPKPNTQFGGPFRAIPTSVPGVQVSELLPRTARQMHHLAVVRSLCTKDNSHSAGVARIQRGDPKNRGVTYPYFGSAVASLLGPGDSGLPPYIWVKPGSGGFVLQDAGFLGPKYGALAFGDGSPPENLIRPEWIGEADANSYVHEMAEQLKKRMDLFDPAAVAPRDVERYGSHEFGRHMLMARRLLEAGVTFVKVNSYGWDTHGDNFNAHLSMVPRFDQSFAAMIEDIADRGMLDDVLVIAMSEFGRTPRINGQIGRDHWPEAWSLVMAGCRTRRGIVVGKTNANGTCVDTEEYDIGHMFHTWFRLLGIDPARAEYDNNGQPLPIAHEGCKAVPDLIA